jgi:hypothetical protein
MAFVTPFGNTLRACLPGAARPLACWLTCGGLTPLAAWVGWPRRVKLPSQ